MKTSRLSSAFAALAFALSLATIGCIGEEEEISLDMSADDLAEARQAPTADSPPIIVLEPIPTTDSDKGATEEASFGSIEAPTDGADAPRDAPTDAPSCGGFRGIGCASGYKCVDDARDDCIPANGDSDCNGVCIASNDTGDTGSGSDMF